MTIFFVKLEIVRLRKHTEILKRTLKAKCDELDEKKSLINRMMEKSLGCPSPSSGEAHSPDGAVEDCVDDLDIESLLQANLGAVNITDFLNISGSENHLLPTDLPDLSVLEEAEAESEKVDF